MRIVKERPAGNHHKQRGGAIMSCELNHRTRGAQFGNLQAGAQGSGSDSRGRRWRATATLTIAAACTLLASPAIADCTDWTNLQPIVGSVDTPGWAFRVAYGDSMVLVGDGAMSGLQVVDVSRPEVPEIVGNLPMAEYANGVALARNLGFVAYDGAPQGLSCGLRIVDLTEPSAPLQLADLEITGSPWDVAVAGNYAYVACYHTGLHVVSISDPHEPYPVGWLDTPGEPRGLAVNGDYAYVADFNGGLVIIDVADPADPQVRGTVATPGEALGVAVAGHYAYVASGFAGMTVVDIADPTSATVVACLDTPDEAWLVAIDGRVAYLADGLSGIHAIDISDPASPHLIGSVDTPGDASGVAVGNDFVYVSDGPAGVQVLRTECEMSGVPPVLQESDAWFLRCTGSSFAGTLLRLPASQCRSLRARLYDSRGRFVREISSDDLTAAGHSLVWDGRDSSGRPVPSGIYLTRLVGHGAAATTRVLVVR